MAKTVKLVGAFFVPLFVVLLVACGQNTGQGDSTLPTATSGSSARSSPTSMNVPQAVRTDVAPVAVPQPEQTASARLTQVVMAATAEVENVTQTVIAFGTIQAYRQRTPTLPPPEEVGQGDFGTWSYKAYMRYEYNSNYKLTGRIYTDISRDTSTVEKLHAYAKANQVLADQLATKGGTARAYITFRTFVEPDQFNSWVKAHGFRVEIISARRTEVTGGQTIDGTITTTAGPNGENPLDPETVKRILEPGGRIDNNGVLTGVGEGETKTIVRGVVYTTVIVDAKQLPSLAADPLVFVSDVTSNVVLNELIAAGVPDAKFAETSEGISPFFSDMEHKFGLDKFQK